mmetsp:Transcript_13732/g.44799  ORF Transcript_13732/g.44799 Transcript_13732/m.44799 type:complete len:370 (+) Transcript_13732:50-1159(+)
MMTSASSLSSLVEAVGSSQRRCALCGVAASLRCRGCLDAMYCSKEHQKADRRRHRPACAPLEEAVDRAVERGRRMQWPVDARAKSPCWVCLSDEGELYRGLCGCRGDAGVAHVDCWVAQAWARVDAFDAFDACPICKQPFLNGVVTMELKYSLWKKRRREGGHPTATSRLGFVLRAVDRDAALRLLRKAVVDDAGSVVDDESGKIRRIHAVTSDAQRYADVLGETRPDDAVALLRTVLETARAAFEDDDVRVMQIRRSLARALLNTNGGKKQNHRAATDEYRDLVQRCTRLHGPNDFSTLVSTFDLARSLIVQDHLHEAIALLTPFVKTATRILGPDHGITTTAASLLDNANNDLLTRPHHCSTGGGNT